MSTGPQSLNLIQRAAKRLGDNAGIIEAPEERNRPAEGGAEPVPARAHEPARPVRVDQPERAPAATRQPTTVEAETTRRGDVRLDYSRMRHDQVLTPDNPASATHDEYRAIKRKLLTMARDGKAETLTRNIVMVTSALPGEGKTFTTLNLMISLAAERNLQVLLIDADVVKPSIREFFIGGDDRGLTDLLNGRAAHVNDVVHRCVDVPNLSVIFAGRHDARSPELMASRRMAEIFAELSAQYPDRIIIMDTPPAVASPEPNALAMHVHQIVLVVGAEQSSRHHVEEALERISACRNISLVFNKSPHWRKAGSSYYYYRHRDGGSPAV
jgi:receptor protein-tyrosine kinase